MKNCKGPFYVKDGEKYVLSDICKECAFGDELGCLMNPCIYFETLAKAWEEQENAELG